MLNKLKNICFDRKHQSKTFSVSDIVVLLTKNLILPGIHRLQLCFVGPFRLLSTGPGSSTKYGCCSPWFYTSLLKPIGPQTSGPPALVDDYYEVEAILQINKRGTHAKVKLVGYDSSQNQWVRLSEL